MWGRIVLIGTIAPDYEDYHRTPFGEISGVEIQAHMISQLVSAVLQNRPILRWLPQQGEWIVVWMFSFLGSVPLWFFWLRRINFNLAVPIILSVSLSPGFCVGFAFFVLWWHKL